MNGPVLVTGGAGYVGAEVATALLEAGREVRVLDSLLHGQQPIADMLEQKGAKVTIGDIASAAGVSAPTLYAQFQSKTGILRAVVERWHGRRYVSARRYRARGCLIGAACVRRAGIDAAALRR